MATYTKVENRGHTLHLIKLSRDLDGSSVYLDITRVVKEAMKQDALAGYEFNGPRAANEIIRASDYADYVSQHITWDTLPNYHTRQYSVFTERAQTADTSNAGTLVSV